MRVDNPEHVRVSADIDEEEREAGGGLPKGDFGDFCPVTYVNDGWLSKGNMEFEATVYGKTYWCAGEKELEEFKVNPAKFLVTQSGAAALPLQPPPPKIMILGTKGSGVTTQIRMLCDKYKLDELCLKDTYRNKMKSEKETRKRRRLLDRGFRPPVLGDEGEVMPDENDEDPEEFDKEAHEKELVRMVCDAQKGLVMDGTWTNQVPIGWRGTDEEKQAKKDEAADGAGFATLLSDARRAPELIIVLDCKETNAAERMISKAETTAEFDRLTAKRLADRVAKREEDRVAKK